MDFEFDPAKDKANIAKHGVSLEIGQEVIRDAAHEFEDDRIDYGEVRMVAFG